MGQAGNISAPLGALIANNSPRAFTVKCLGSRGRESQTATQIASVAKQGELLVPVPEPYRAFAGLPASDFAYSLGNVKFCKRNFRLGISGSSAARPNLLMCRHQHQSPIDRPSQQGSTRRRS